MQHIDALKARWRLSRWRSLCKTRGRLDTQIARLSEEGDPALSEYIDRLKALSFRLSQKIETLEHKERQYRVSD